MQAFHQYIEPSMRFADIVVPQGAENKVAMDLIVHHVKDKLKKVGMQYWECSIGNLPLSTQLAMPPVLLATDLLSINFFKFDFPKRAPHIEM